MAKLKEILGDAFNQIPEDLQKKYENIDLVDGTEYVKKSDYDELDKNAKQYKKDILKRDQDLKDLKEKVKDNEELNKEIIRLQGENEKANEDHEAEIKKFKFDAALEKKLGEYKPKNLGILKKALEMEKISLDGDNILGLEEQITRLKESDSYLFSEESPQGGTGSLGGGSSLIDDKKGQLSLGARLAEQRKSANQVTELQNKFFS
ncbi:Skp family chaperone for outer membrane proteins [Clostridium pascui]|uniref:phage scaffolding protein n=1 Tax=Clostridium pascui TaxID=46609 RepID=UPI00195DDA92|nr:phage scaffolding protein [Clostridium pascui]MBM7869308.1 Skp family chaperone for outer membrane proteins [Clostridium pascui]